MSAHTGPPVGLRATPKDGKVILTWSPPANGACVDTYVLNVYDDPRGFRSASSSSDAGGGIPYRSTSTSLQSTTIGGLTNLARYKFVVQVCEWLCAFSFPD